MRAMSSARRVSSAKAMSRPWPERNVQPSAGMSTQHQNATDDPWAIAHNSNLAIEAKVQRLRQLEFDARQALVAAEEGMLGSRSPRLHDIRAALASLGVEDVPLGGSTKM